MDLINVKDENEKNELLEDLKKSPKNDKIDLDVKKKQLTLNLGSSKPRKRTVGNNNSVSSLLDSGSAIWTPSMSRVILESPDVQMLKLHTPDVEKFISNLNSTPTPSLANRRFYDPTQIIKQLGDNFNDNFNSKTNSNSDSSRPPSNASSNYFPNNDPFTMQDDNSNGTSMISGNNSNCSFNTSNNSTNNQSYTENNSDLESLGVLKNQELSKLERKRLRNRIAASKCRKRKLERISNLENRVQQLKGENTELTQLVIKLKENINHLKQEVLEHMKNGCNINTSLVQN